MCKPNEIDNHSQNTGANNRHELLERYRMTVYGSVRDDYSTAITALDNSIQKLSVVHKAIQNIEPRQESDELSGLLMGIQDIFSDSLETMKQALTLLDNCE